jgi:hypothetical protein
MPMMALRPQPRTSPAHAIRSHTSCSRAWREEMRAMQATMQMTSAEPRSRWLVEGVISFAIFGALAIGAVTLKLVVFLPTFVR